MGLKVLVCGNKRFTDFKLLHRAMDAVHRKHFISTLITGEYKGAEELAYFWAVSRHISEIITVPTTSDLTGKFCTQRRAFHVLQKYSPDVVVAFSYPTPVAMVSLAESRGFKVWDVPKAWG